MIRPARQLIPKDAVDESPPLRLSSAESTSEASASSRGSVRVARDPATSSITITFRLPEIRGRSFGARLLWEDDGSPVVVIEEPQDARDDHDADDIAGDGPTLVAVEDEGVYAILSEGSTAEAPTEPSERIERFGDIEVNASRRTVERHGQPVQLSPKTFDLLLALIERRGTVATRRELLSTVWGGRAKDGTRTVDTHVFELRKRLEDDSAKPRHILTVMKSGYRFQP
jgi:DNA-binding response OmpR family regulator